MKVAIFGATGALGMECLEQSLAAGHQGFVLARTPSELPARLRDQVSVVEGDALGRADVEKALVDVESVLFAIGVDGKSPEDLCAEVEAPWSRTIKSPLAPDSSNSSPRSSWACATATRSTSSSS